MVAIRAGPILVSDQIINNRGWSLTRAFLAKVLGICEFLLMIQKRTVGNAPTKTASGNFLILIQYTCVKISEISLEIIKQQTSTLSLKNFKLET